MDAFVHEALPGRIVFGAGSLDRVADELERLGAQRVFLVADAQAKAFGDTVAAALGARVAAQWHEVVQHVPVELAERARTAVSEARADAVVTIGGGSSTGLGKAIALSHEIPIVAVPTTYAGSEMTPIYGMTGGAHKATGRSLSVLPKVVVYDPELTLGLPPSVTGPSAFNALAHCVEALYAPGHNPVVSALALEGVKAIHRSLPRVMHAPSDVGARGDLLYGAHLAGVALGATGTALHHKLCHVLGGMFNLVHADAHSVILPHAVAYMTPALPDEMARLADALGAPSGDPAAELYDLAVASDVPVSLAAIHMPEDGIEAAARQGAIEITNNPARAVDEEALRALLIDAYAGRRPTSTF